MTWLAGNLRFYGYSESIPVRKVSTGAGIMHKKDVDLHPMFLNAELFDVSEEIENYKRQTGQTEGPEAALLDRYYTALQAGEYSRWASGSRHCRIRKSRNKRARRTDPGRGGRASKGR